MSDSLREHADRFDTLQAKVAENSREIAKLNRKKVTAMDNVQQLKSYVWHGEECFFVSTIERDASAIRELRRFMETLVWDYDWGNETRGNLIGTRADGSALGQHFAACTQLYQDGKLKVEDDDLESICSAIVRAEAET